MKTRNSYQRRLVGTSTAHYLLIGALVILIGAQPGTTWGATQTELQKLTASQSGVTFGDSFALDGDTAAITADGGEAEDGRNVGLVYVFNRRHTGKWAEQQRIIHMDSGEGDGFGGSIGLDGNILLVGASADQENGTNSGATYVYKRGSDGIWIEQQKLIASDGIAWDFFGGAVAVDGDTALICASMRGFVYVYTRDGKGIWTERQKLTVSDGYFASSVDIDGDTALIGAQHDDENGTSSGAAYVFTRGADGMWTEHQKLTAVDSQEHDRFGASVSMDTITAVIGAAVSEYLDRPGSAYVFVRQVDGLWIEKQKLTASDGEPADLFGGSVDVDGDVAVIGAMNHDYLGTNSGAVYVFTRSKSGVWKEQQRLVRSDGGEHDQFGSIVAVDSGVALVGEYSWEYTGRNASVYVFALKRKVDIDIKPYNRQNTINPRSRGGIWVVILSDAEFDPLQVKIRSVRFGPDKAKAIRHRVRDINRDGVADLMLRFKVRKTGIQCGDKRARLKAKTYFGERVVGSDSIKTVGCKKKRCK